VPSKTCCHRSVPLGSKDAVKTSEFDEDPEIPVTYELPAASTTKPWSPAESEEPSGRSDTHSGNICARADSQQMIGDRTVPRANVRKAKDSRDMKR
jgi:hypothetical protein